MALAQAGRRCRWLANSRNPTVGLSMLAFDGIITAALNHLIRNEPWAQERLRCHAGSQASIRAGLVNVYLVVDGAGLFQAGVADQPVGVTISLPADTPIRFLADRKSVFQAAKLTGSADFAETLAFVFRNLRWDIEADLASYLGDIPARRIEMLRAVLLKQATESGQRIFANLAEYASEESDCLVPRRDVDAFGKAVDALRDDLARLEKRLQRL